MYMPASSELEKVCRIISLDNYPAATRKCNSLHARIGQILRRKLQNFHRSFIGGSFAKGTALYYKYDLDIMVFINVCGCRSISSYITERRKTLKRLMTIISEEFSIRARYNLQSPYFSIYFTIDDIKIDLVVALDLIGDDDVNMANLSTLQYDRAINLVHQDKERQPWINAYELSSSLSESAVEFIKKESDFVKKVVIICKHWLFIYCKEIHFGGKSSTIELIAINIGRKFETPGDIGMALKQFLLTLTNIDQINMDMFQHSNSNVFNSRYIDKLSPRIIDPQNPYNNRLKRIKHNQIVQIKKIAKTHVENFPACISSILSHRKTKSNTKRLSTNNKSLFYILMCLVGVFLGSLLLISFAFIFTTENKEQALQNSDTKNLTYIKNCPVCNDVIIKEVKLKEELDKLNAKIRLLLEISDITHSTFQDILKLIGKLNTWIGNQFCVYNCNSCTNSCNVVKRFDFTREKVAAINNAIKKFDKLLGLPLDDEEYNLFILLAVRSMRVELIKLRELIRRESPDQSNLSEDMFDDLDKISVEEFGSTLTSEVMLQIKKVMEEINVTVNKFFTINVRILKIMEKRKDEITRDQQNLYRRVDEHLTERVLQILQNHGIYLTHLYYQGK